MTTPTEPTQAKIELSHKGQPVLCTTSGSTVKTTFTAESAQLAELETGEWTAPSVDVPTLELIIVRTQSAEGRPMQPLIVPIIVLPNKSAKGR